MADFKKQVRAVRRGIDQQGETDHEQKAYGFRAFDAVKTALYHNLGSLPEPEFTHSFC